MLKKTELRNCLSTFEGRTEKYIPQNNYELQNEKHKFFNELEPIISFQLTPTRSSDQSCNGVNSDRPSFLAEFTPTSIPAGNDFASHLRDLHDLLVENVKQAQDYQELYYEKKHNRSLLKMQMYVICTDYLWTYLRRRNTVAHQQILNLSTEM